MDITITEDETEGLVVTIHEGDGRPASVDASALATRERTEGDPTGTDPTATDRPDPVDAPEAPGLDGGEAPSLLVFGERTPSESTEGHERPPEAIGGSEKRTHPRERPAAGVFSGGEYDRPQLDRADRSEEHTVSENAIDAVEDVRSGGVYGRPESRRSSADGGRSAIESQSRRIVDPGQYTVEELEDEVEAIADRDRLDAMLARERDEQDRRTAKDAIRRRLRALEEH